MKTRILAGADMTRLLEVVGLHEFMDLMIERLRARFLDHSADAVEVRPRDGFRYEKPDLGLIEWMPTHETGGPVVVKMVGYHPANPVQRALPSVIATSSMWDTESGHLVALADATLLTAVRTGAASALATELLARRGPIAVGLVGLGAQAVTQLHAISRVCDVDHVIGFDNDPDVAATFSQRAGFLGLDISVSGSDRAATILGEVDVLCTCTSVDIGAGPVIADCETRDWLHVNAVGADFPGKLELPSAFVNRSFVVPDTLEQCVLEGECQQVSSDRIGPTLSELVQRADEHVERRDQLTVFDSTGWAVEDDVALRLAVELASAHGAGSQIELERLPRDPYDPYGAV
ncbi:MAG TPA: ornithine cyclodeaminase family protein [Ilumatobacteraceae bacterium]|nr:ornithine cyclodeaminase family protein [Ilumatobacteraceae bacterium]